MNDITTPSSNTPPSGARITDGTTSVTKDPQHNARQNQENIPSSDNQTPTETARARDPAVTIAATTAGINIGDNVEQSVSRIDVEGRPIIVTDFATFALRPDAGLKVGDNVNLEVTEANRQIFANLREQNNQQIDPPIRLELVIIALNTRGDEQPALLQPLNQPTNVDNVPISTLTPEVTISEAIASEIATQLETRPLTPEQIGEQRLQIVGTTDNQQPIIVTDFATYAVSTSLSLNPNDDLTINIISPSASNRDITAEIRAVNSTTLTEPVSAILSQIPPISNTPIIPQNETEALALANRQSELVAGNVQITSTSLSNTLSDELETIAGNTPQAPQIQPSTPLTIRLNETDRTLPAQNSSSVISIAQEVRSPETLNASNPASENRISLTGSERPSFSSAANTQGPQSTNRLSENTNVSFQVQTPQNERVEQNGAENNETREGLRPPQTQSRPTPSKEVQTPIITDNRQPPTNIQRDTATPETDTSQSTSDSYEVNRDITLPRLTQDDTSTVPTSGPLPTASQPSSVTQNTATSPEENSINANITGTIINASQASDISDEYLSGQLTSIEVSRNTPASQSPDDITNVSVPITQPTSVPIINETEVSSPSSLINNNIFSAYTLSGESITFEALDLATSTVNPANIVQINGFTPLLIAETRSLSLPITAFANLSTELVKLDTSRGPFILPSNIAQNLLGETVAISGLSAEALSRLPVQETAQNIIPQSHNRPATKATLDNAGQLATNNRITPPSPDLVSPQTPPTVGTPIINETPANLPILTGLGGFLQSLETLPAIITPNPEIAGTPIANNISNQNVSIAVIPQKTIEATALQSASSNESLVKSDLAIERGSLSQIAQLADTIEPITNTVSNDESTQPQLPLGPTRIDGIEISAPNSRAVASTNSIVLSTASGLITFEAPPQFLPKTGDIAIILPAIGDDNIATLIGQSLGNFARAIPNTPAPVSSLDPIALNAWPALAESVSILNRQQNSEAGTLTSKSAQGGRTLTNGLLFLLNAARLGNPSAWIGTRTEQTLENDNIRLLETLKRDISSLINIANDPVGDWRPISLPFDIRGNDIPFITMLLRNEPDQQRQSRDDTPDDNNHERFIIEINFTNIGSVQLDGYIKGQKFDLTLRSKTTLPQGLATELKHLFKTAADANNFQGSLFIEQETSFPVNVQETLSKNVNPSQSLPHSS
jgi:hypothetical protein